METTGRAVPETARVRISIRGTKRDRAVGRPKGGQLGRENTDDAGRLCDDLIAEKCVCVSVGGGPHPPKKKKCCVFSLGLLFSMWIFLYPLSTIIFLLSL
jgi:hypothetical protein